MNQALKGTQTELNLLKSFAGESMARNKYTYFASLARKAGFVQISNIFQETADNEKEHAKAFFKHLKDSCAEITFTTGSIALDSVEACLLAAAEGEKEEWEDLYPSFANIAEAEGFPEIAHCFREIAHAESHHEARFRKLLSNVQDGSVFKKDEVTSWKCGNCGYVHEGTEAPLVCLACNHPRAHFEVLAVNY